MQSPVVSEPGPTVFSSRKRDMTLGLSILIVTFAGTMALSLWAMRLSTPVEPHPPLPPSAEGIEGFPERVDPIALLDRARALSMRTLFVGLTMKGITREGTIDLTNESHYARFSFQDPRGLGAQPPRKGGTLPERTYCGRQSVKLDSNGLGASPDLSGGHCPSGGPEALLPPPKSCPISKVFAMAEKRKVLGRGEVQIEYYQSRGGPAYRFKQGKRQFSLDATNCKHVLSNKEERGSVP